MSTFHRGPSQPDLFLTESAVSSQTLRVESSRTALQAAVSRIGDAREDWKILRALSEVLDKTLPYSNLQGVQQRLADLAPHLGRVDTIEPPLWLNGQYFKVLLITELPPAAYNQSLRFKPPSLRGFVCYPHVWLSESIAVKYKILQSTDRGSKSLCRPSRTGPRPRRLRRRHSPAA